MIDLGLSAADRRVFEAQLAQAQQVRISVVVLDRDENPLGSLTAPASQVVSGDVQVDANAGISRSLSLVIMDPHGKLDMVPDSPADAAMYADNLVSVTRGIYVTALNRWVDVPVFTGPVSRMRRTDGQVEIEAVGKEWLTLDPHLLWRSLTFGKGRRVTDAIRSVLEAYGERHFDMPSIGNRLPKHLSVTRHQEGWKVAKHLAQSVDRQAFYDGAGRVRLRMRPENPVYTFTTGGDDGIVLDSPELDFDLNKVRNTIEVLGPEPDGPRRRLRFVAHAPANHPLSAARLARNGEPRRMVETVQNDHLRRNRDAEALAYRTLRDRLRASVEASFTALVVPHVEEHDLVGLVLADGQRLDFRMTEFSIPLTDGSMSVGFLQRVETGPTARRRRRRGGR